ncbi:MAG: NAD(+)/NADH kinase [Chloroflexota bacterium]
MGAVALVYQPYRPETLETAQEVAAWLGRRGTESALLSAFDLDRPAAQFQIAMSFGGDGTTLRTARWAVTAAVPVIPVGMGTLSFLAELAPSDIEMRLAAYLEGDFWRDERAMLELSYGDRRVLALNDVVVARGAPIRAVSVDLAVHGYAVTRYTADGLVVATATGSTAYALSVGGPVLAPELRSMVVAPIAGHLSSLRAMVLPESAVLTLTVVRRQAAVVSADGQVDFDLPVGASVGVRVADVRTVFARRGDPGLFYAKLTARLRRG